MMIDKSRREFLCSVAGCAAAAAAGGCGDFTHSEFFRKRFREIGAEEMAGILKDIEERNFEKFQVDTTVTATDAIEGVEFGYALDLSRCVGCRRCADACTTENNHTRNPDLSWIRVLEMDEEHGVDFHYANPYYEPESVPEEGHFYLPMACQQCRNAPCVKSCPVGATWQEKDGIVVVDYNWCIGCRCCMASCPYGARRFNWKEPDITGEDINPDQHYLGNRVRPKGVVEKCTFCIQRSRDGRYPACVEACPVGARKFGDLNDPNSEINYVLRNKRTFVLKADLNTRPRFYYFFG